jgi:hypothetical protein
MTTELVPTDTPLPLAPSHYNDAVALIDHWRESGDTENLFEAVGQAEALKLLNERQRNLDAAAGFARLKILAEAALGVLDARSVSRLSEATGDLRIGDTEISKSRREKWRLMGVASIRGELAGILDEIDPDDMNTRTVAATCRESGVWSVPAGCLREAFERSDLTIAELATRTKLSKVTVMRLVKKPVNGVVYGGATIRWTIADEVGALLGVETASLPIRRTRRLQKTARRRLWITRERKPTGGKWDKPYGYFRQCIQAFDAIAGNTDPRWDEAWKHFEALNKILEEQQRKERQR